jgi:hypothetical protein
MELRKIVTLAPLLILIASCTFLKQETKQLNPEVGALSTKKTIYRVCSGEEPSQCRLRFGQNIVHLRPQPFPPTAPGAADDNQKVADLICSRSGLGGDGARGVRLATQDGGCCGYQLIEVTCFDK